MTHAELIAVIDALPLDERMSLACHILEAATPTGGRSEEETLAIAQQRWDAYQRGETGTVDADEVFRGLGIQL
jgi:hypothetical protein